MKRRDVSDRNLHDAALRMARRCRFVIQSCLREEEWRDCDTEFYAVILEGLKELQDGRDRNQA